MIAYAQITDEQTKQVSVGLGTDTAYYESIGMTQMEVEQAYNGAWYVKGYAPEESEEEKEAKRRAAIIAQLNALDLKAIRSMRAIQAGTGTPEDQLYLANIETQAQALREQLGA